MKTKPAALSKKKRTKPAPQRRQELLEAAQRLFLEQGIGSTSVDEIVAAAGVAKGTFYLHFGSKEELMEALRQSFVAGLHEHLRQAVERCPSDKPQRRLRAWIEAGVDGYLDRQALHDLVFLTSRPGGRPAKNDSPAVRLLAGLLREGTQTGAWSVKDAEFTAALLFHALHGAVDDALAAGGKVDRKRLCKALETFFGRAVGAV